MTRRLIGVTSLIAVAIVTSALTSAIAGRVQKRQGAGVGPAPVSRPGGTTMLGPDPRQPERLRAIYLEQQNRVIGTKVGFDPEQGGLLAAAHERPNEIVEEARRRFTESFPLLDPEPAERIEHFRWLEQPGMKRKGWYATVRDVAVTPAGVVVKVRLSPYLVHVRGGVTMTSDYVEEHYALDGRGIKYLGSSAPPPERARMVFGD